MRCLRRTLVSVLTLIPNCPPPRQVIQMVMNSQESMDRTATAAARLLKELDEDGNGRVTFEEFLVCTHAVGSRIVP